MTKNNEFEYRYKVFNEEGKVNYTEQILETVDEPNYEKALDSLSK